MVIIMDTYEKKYKEEVARATQLWECGDITRENLEYIFPELKESEEEKIVDAIRKELKACIEDLGNGVTRSACLAWLEKQNHDGKKWIYEDVYLKEKEQLIQDGIDEVLENPQKYGLEKQSEQKPAEWHREDEQNLNACLGFIPDGFLRRWLKDVVHVKYDKPTWNEEDNEMLRSIMATCELAEQDRDSSPAKHLLEMQLNWLKSLKQRIGG